MCMCVCAHLLHNAYIYIYICDNSSFNRFNVYVFIYFSSDKLGYSEVRVMNLRVIIGHHGSKSTPLMSARTTHGPWFALQVAAQLLSWSQSHYGWRTNLKMFETWTWKPTSMKPHWLVLSCVALSCASFLSRTPEKQHTCWFQRQAGDLPFRKTRQFSSCEVNIVTNSGAMDEH